MGRFVTFEGGDGCGKSTLLQGLKNYLDANGIDYIATREPGGLKICEDIRKIVLYSVEKIGKKAELLLYSASRAQLVDDFIVPNLEAGRLVLCDRFFDSTRVYQGYANDMDENEVLNICKFATSGLVPDLTFILDIDPVVAFERKGGREQNDRIEKREIEYHDKVRMGYLALAKNESRFVVIDATLSKEEIVQKVVAKLKEKRLI